jgi:outer membrane lipoprotein SlyB
MRTTAVLLASAISLATLAGCANQDPYQDPTYTLQRDLYHRNQKWDQTQNRMRMRREAQDERYQAWFNNVME